MKKMFAVAVVVLSVAGRLSAVVAFPGAEGFGANAVGGRGGRVLFVTNLEDSGPGSLRAAVEAKGARTVIFKVSGTIALESTLGIRRPYMTIAGQTAPGDGICLKNYGLSIGADHVIVRYLRCRPGDGSGREPDAVSISSGHDIIVDHCSASWSVDETLSASARSNLGNVTVQWCIISQSLNESSHHKGSHGYGSLIRGGDGGAYTFHHNLYAHHRGRSPRPGNYTSADKDPKGFTFDFRNNVLYNWGGSHSGYNADGSNGDMSITRMNFVGNYYLRGPNSSGAMAFSESTPTACAYFAGNAMNGETPDDPWSLVSFSGGFSDAQRQAYKKSQPIAAPPVTAHTAEQAYELVLAGAGATLPKRDTIDASVVEQVRRRTGGIINGVADAGGWPKLESTVAPEDSDRDGIPNGWEKTHNLNPYDAADAVKTTASGYTGLELYLNSITGG